LSVVKALLVADIESPGISEPKAPQRRQRKIDVTLGALSMCALALHSIWTTEEFSLEWQYTSLIIKCLILCVLINIVPVIRDFLSARVTQNSTSSPKMLSGFMAGFKNRDQYSALPDAYPRPAADYFTGRVKTAELVQPPSVTEDTTNLLRNN
jgi:hypothetical protein